MNGVRSQNFSAFAATTLLFSICIASCAAYKPAPLKPTDLAHQFAERTLTTPDLCRYLSANLTAILSACPPAHWNIALLTLAGFFYNPDLAVAEAKLRVAQAAIVTAKQRLNPAIGLGPVYTASAAPAFAPWALGAAELNFSIETAGKRGYRIAQAERLADAAAFDVGETAWHVRSEVRTALLNHLLARREDYLARAYESVSKRTAHLLQERVSAGAASAPELNLMLANLAAARFRVKQAQSRIAETLNALAVALGVPAEAVQGMTFSWPELEHPPDEATLTPAQVRQLALLNRIDLCKMLAEYAAAEEALKLEIARQYPDVNLGGGYSWEVGENLFQLLPLVTLPVMNHNQGPIAEARARRALVAAEFAAQQQNVIAQADGALTKYRGGLAAFRQASSAAAFSHRRLAGMERAAELGDIDALALATAQLETIVAEQSRATALAEAQARLGLLEEAIQRPLTDDNLKKSFSPPPLRNLSTQERS
jgi:outer membrane protein TolC